MIVEWSISATQDARRVYNFLADMHPQVADVVMGDIFRFITLLKEQPRLGRVLGRYQNRDVRSSIVGRYEVRYERVSNKIIILRIWHVREYRE